MFERSDGFSLIELLFATAVGALLVAGASPAISSVLARSQVASLHNEFVAGLATARLEALRSRKSTVFCPLDESTQGCRGDGDWSSGWLAYIDRNADGRMNAGEAALQVVQVNAGSAMSIYSGVHRPEVRYAPNGMSQGSNVTIRFCVDGRAMTALVINNAGRPRIERDAQRLASYSCAS